MRRPERPFNHSEIVRIERHHKRSRGDVFSQQVHRRIARCEQIHNNAAWLCAHILHESRVSVHSSSHRNLDGRFQGHDGGSRIRCHLIKILLESECDFLTTFACFPTQCRLVVVTPRCARLAHPIGRGCGRRDLLCIERTHGEGHAYLHVQRCIVHRV